MEVSLRPMGGLRETGSSQPLVAALRRAVFLQRRTSVGREGRQRVSLDKDKDKDKDKDHLCLTVARRLHAAQTVALHQRTRQRLVTGAFRQTAPAGLTNQSRVWAEPLVIHHCFFKIKLTVTARLVSFTNKHLKKQTIF